MKPIAYFSALLSILFLQCSPRDTAIFDGETFAGWEGDTVNTWRIEDGAIVGGSLQETVPRNDFICTTKSYDDFVLRLKFQLRGDEGFINAGVQIRSQRHDDPDYEMIGYQADLGDGFWGCLYDESRRNKILAAPDSSVIARVLDREGWNDYEIRAKGGRIQLFINGEQTVDYTEPVDSIPRSGLIGLQIHGGGKAEVRYKDLRIQPL